MPSNEKQASTPESKNEQNLQKGSPNASNAYPGPWAEVSPHMLIPFVPPTTQDGPRMPELTSVYEEKKKSKPNLKPKILIVLSLRESCNYLD